MNGTWQRPKVSVVASDTGEYRQLDAVAAALGVRHQGGLELDLLIDGWSVRLSLEMSSGSIIGLKVFVFLDIRAAEDPWIELRRESAADRAEKAGGITREVQTGYEPFDAHVFIDNDASEADATRLLAWPAVRDAVLRLLGGGCSWVKMTPRSVHAYLPIRDSVFPPEATIGAIQQLMVVARAGAPREPGTRRGFLVAVLAWLLAPAAPLFLWYARTHWHAGWTFHLIGVGVGLLAWVIARPLIRRLVTGDSRSYNRYLTIHVPLLIFGPMLSTAVLLTLNGALDKSPPYRVTGTVTSVDDTDPANRMDNFYVKWSDGWTTREAMELSVYEGDTFWQERHAGALGFEWYRGDPQPLKMRYPP